MTPYFARFESRQPAAPIAHSAIRELVAQFLTVICLALGAWYIVWRWTESLNPAALWFAIPVAIAETGAYVGLILYSIGIWKVADLPILDPPTGINDCLQTPVETDRPVSVDIFLTTYNEDPELVRLGLQAAKALRYPHPLDLNVYVLDDGRRESMRSIAEAEGVGYITRSDNVGFKAGNLRNAMEQTAGDFIVICDADTRVFPTLLQRTLGYFRDPRMAWVQTPQWFFDLPEGERLPDMLQRRLGAWGARAGRGVERLVGRVTLGADPFVNDATLFYDVIQRRRNWANAAFCCGAGSIHRREAVMDGALRSYASAVDRASRSTLASWSRRFRETEPDPQLCHAIRAQVACEEEFVPYKFHVSEDIYTSISLHGDRERGWKSYLHPHVETKMLSPQDLLSWTVQRFKYAGGSLDIFLNDNPLFRPGLTVPQRLMYASTFWSYLGGLWNMVFLVAPMIYLFSGVSPVEAYTSEFVWRLAPFLLFMEISSMVSTWGIEGQRSKASYISFFAVNLRALWTVARGKRISFPVTPKERQDGRHLHLVAPQIVLIGLTLASIATAMTLQVLHVADYSAAGLLTNIFWGLNNILALLGMVMAAFWRPDARLEGAYVKTTVVESTKRRRDTLRAETHA